jgi:hypothetical protein
LASASATGGSGDAIAQADTGVNQLGSQPVLSASAKATGSVVGQSAASASLAYGNTAFASTAQGAVAQAVLAPTAASAAVKGVLDAAGNSAIKAAFTPNHGFFAVGELGAAHAASGTAVETDSAQFSVSLDQGDSHAGQNLLLGLYGGQLVGSGVTQVVLTLDENGTSINDTYTAGQAVTAFTDGVIELGPLAASGAYDLTVELSVTSDAAQSGFYGGFIAGASTNAMAPHLAVDLPHDGMDGGPLFHAIVQAA